MRDLDSIRLDETMLYLSKRDPEEYVDRLVSGCMAQRGVTYDVATASVAQAMQELPGVSWRDTLERANEIAVPRSPRRRDPLTYAPRRPLKRERPEPEPTNPWVLFASVVGTLALALVSILVSSALFGPR